MMSVFVYKITRIDDKEYIGITINLNKRFRDHSHTERFSLGIKEKLVLIECDDYKEAEIWEEFYINLYDTFNNGLNKSKNGKGNHCAPNFTTLGFKYSEESRKKMSDNNWLKDGKNPSPNKGMIHKDDIKKQWSEKRKRIMWRERTIPIDTALEIQNNYKNNLLEFSDEFLRRHVKSSQKEKIFFLDMSELKSQNGKALDKLALYCIYYSELLNVSGAAIKYLLTRTTELAKDYVKETE